MELAPLVHHPPRRGEKHVAYDACSPVSKASQRVGKVNLQYQKGLLTDEEWMSKTLEILNEAGLAHYKGQAQDA